MTRRLLAEAQRLYVRAEPGVALLPMTARPGIFAARHVYAGIGAAARANGFDTVNHRAATGTGQKLGWLGLSLLRTAATMVMPHQATIYARPLPETRFLVEAAARADRQPAPWGAARSGALMAALAQLETHDRAQKLARRAASAT